jgi:biotin carboxyl carrier protein
MKDLSHKVRALGAKGVIWVQYKGRIHRVVDEAKARTGKQSAQGPKDLIAPFNCKVVKIFVQAGSELKEGEPVLSVEAMKMEYTYASPRSGKIAQINVKEGEVVPEGTSFVAWE